MTKIYIIKDFPSRDKYDTTDKIESLFDLDKIDDLPEPVQKKLKSRRGRKYTGTSDKVLYVFYLGRSDVLSINQALAASFRFFGMKDVSPKYVSTICVNLYKRKYLNRTDYGTYKISEEGIKYIKEIYGEYV